MKSSEAETLILAGAGTVWDIITDAGKRAFRLQVRQTPRPAHDVERQPAELLSFHLEGAIDGLGSSGWYEQAKLAHRHADSPDFLGTGSSVRPRVIGPSHSGGHGARGLSQIPLTRAEARSRQRFPPQVHRELSSSGRRHQLPSAAMLSASIRASAASSTLYSASSTAQ